MKWLKKKQQGFSFMQMTLGLVVAGIATSAAVDYQVRQERRQDFQILGNKIADYSRAVADWSVDQGGAAIPGTRTGTDWLKSNTECGITTGGTVAYLPCGFDFLDVKYGVNPVTTVTNSSGVTIANTTYPAITTGGIPEAVGVGIAVEQAEAAAQNTMAGVVVYSEDNTGVITAAVDINNSTGIYVKKTGDTMTGDLTMSGANINNVGVMNATQGAFGTVNATGNISSLGNIDATGDIQGQQFVDADDPTTFLNPSGTSRIATLESSTIRDRDDTSYYLDMNNTSRLASLDVSSNVNVQGELYIARVVTEGASCTKNGVIARLSTGKPVGCTSGKWEVINGEAPDPVEPITHCKAQTLKMYKPRTPLNRYNWNSTSSYSLSQNYSAPETAIGSSRSWSGTEGSTGCGRSRYRFTSTRTCFATGEFGAAVLTTSKTDGVCSPG